MSSIKLTPEQEEKLTSLGFSGKTDAEVRPAILKKLLEFDVPDVEEDPIEDLIGIVEAFMEIEEEIPEPKKVVKKKAVKKTTQVNEIDEAEEVLEEAEELLEEAAKPEATDNVVEEVEIEEDVAPVKVKKVAKKAMKVPTPKVIRVAYDGDIPEHVSKIKEILKPYLDKYGLDGSYENKSCIAITLDKSDGKRSVLCVESIIFKGDETFIKVVFNGMNLFRKTADLKEVMEDTLHDDFLERLCIHKNNSYPFVKTVNSKELPLLITDEMINPILTKMNSFDKKLRKNREKMEEEYEKSEKK